MDRCTPFARMNRDAYLLPEQRKPANKPWADRPWPQMHIVTFVDQFGFWMVGVETGHVPL